jgi:hypothetical protein
MTEPPADRSEQFERYLLGQLSEIDAAALEDRFFADDEIFAQLEVAADDLADRYVAGRLTPDVKRRFERYCLGSTDDRVRVRVAAALRRYVTAQPQAKPASFWQSLVDLFTGWGRGLRFVTAAAALVMVAGVSMLALRTARLQQELQQLRTGMSDELAATRQSAEQALQQERAQRETLEQRLRDLTTSSFVLTPGLDRGAGDSDLLVGKDASFVRFDLALERPASTGRYRVTLRTVNRDTLWSQDVTPAPGTPASELSVTIPALVIGAGELEVVVQEVSPAGGTTEIATYSFRIVRGR